LGATEFAVDKEVGVGRKGVVVCLKPHFAFYTVLGHHGGHPVGVVSRGASHVDGNRGAALALEGRLQGGRVPVVWLGDPGADRSGTRASLSAVLCFTRSFGSGASVNVSALDLVELVDGAASARDDGGGRIAEFGAVDGMGGDRVVLVGESGAELLAPGLPPPVGVMVGAPLGRIGCADVARLDLVKGAPLPPC
jgi:hypothetical protein